MRQGRQKEGGIMSECQIIGSWKPSLELLKAAVNDPGTSELIKRASDWLEVLQIIRKLETVRRRNER
jgi:hypothetical protein